MVQVNMTPIKIPGKNNRDQRRSVIAANRHLQKRPRPPGRPPKTLVEDLSRDSTPTSVESGRSVKPRSLKTLKSHRRMANLEKLPTEILTSIFLFSMNLELPRASPIIAGKLSSRLTIVEAIMNAFRPTWEYYYELVQSDREAQTPVPGNPKLQSAVLRCRCATLSTLRHAEATWLHRTALGRKENHLTPFQTSAIDRSRSRRRQTTPDDRFIARYRSEWRHKTTDDCFTEDYAEFMQLSSERIIEDMSSEFTPRWAWSAFLHMHPQFDIPESLLQGPWTPDMVEYLFWLIRAEARIRWANSMNGEVALLGLRNAISTGNLQLLCIFQYLGLANNVTPDIVEWAIVNAGGDKLEVIARLMRMLLGGHSDPALIHLKVAGALSRMRRMAQRQSDGSQDKVEAVALREALEAYWSFLSSVGNKVIVKGQSIHGDRIL